MGSTRKEEQPMRDKLIAAFATEALRERLRGRAFEERCSMSEVVRRALTEYLGKRKQRKGTKR
jgi:hypothetical protein